jgi:hypothetical protein
MVVVVVVVGWGGGGCKLTCHQLVTEITRLTTTLGKGKFIPRTGHEGPEGE